MPKLPAVLLDRLLVTSLPLLLLLTPSARSDTVTLTSAADTSLFENNPDNNLGAGELAAGTTAGTTGAPARSRALIRFDLAGRVPADAVITSVAFTITVGSTPSPTFANSIFDLRRMLKPWTEGNKPGQTGSPATAGETTWRAQSASSTPANAKLWSRPGGVAGTEFSDSVSTSVQIAGKGKYKFSSTSALVADVQSWLKDPGTNFGWILMTESEATARTARRFYDRSVAQATNRPSLLIEYTIAPPPPTAPTLTQPRGVGNTFTFEFTAEANHSQTVEFIQSIPSAQWQTLTNFSAEAAARKLTVTDEISSDSTSRFYRVRLE